MLERHPQMYSSFHDIQLDLPENNQAIPSSDSPAPLTLLTVEYAEKNKFLRGKGISFNIHQHLSTNLNL